MNLPELWAYFKLLSDREVLKQEERTFLEGFLLEERRLREQKRVRHLMKRSGIKRVKLLEDFDWAFNPKLPRDKVTEFMHTDWLRRPANLLLIGPAGVGKTHVATALCHDALSKGRQTVFTTLFDFTARLKRARNTLGLIDHYGRVPVLCLDEVGYAMPTREEADAIFQIVSRRSETGTTLVTTNLVPSEWGRIFEGATASAILDRLSMNGRFLTFEGRSYRSGRR